MGYWALECCKLYTTLFILDKFSIPIATSPVFVIKSLFAILEVSILSLALLSCSEPAFKSILCAPFLTAFISHLDDVGTRLERGHITYTIWEQKLLSTSSFIAPFDTFQMEKESKTWPLFFLLQEILKGQKLENVGHEVHNFIHVWKKYLDRLPSPPTNILILGKNAAIWWNFWNIWCSHFWGC